MRTRNEDRALAHRLDGQTALLAVADGVGGVSGGHLASEAAVRALADHLLSSVLASPVDSLREAFAHANTAVRRLQADTRMSMATTLVAAIIRERTAWIANVGDSRAYLLNGHLTQITRDHSVVAEQLASGAISSAAGAREEHQNIITRGVGMDDALRTDIIGPIALKPGARLLLCSDGVYGPLDASAILGSNTGASASRAVSNIIAMANEAGGPDNIAAALCIVADQE
jgi:protein phosphatase